MSCGTQVMLIVIGMAALSSCISNLLCQLKLFGPGGFFHAYFVLGTADPEPSLGYSSLLATFRLGVLGDFDMSELEGTDEGGELYTYSHIWFYLASLLVTMLMMNILVGILGSNYDRFEDQSKQLFVQKRAKALMVLSTRPWYPTSCQLESLARMHARIYA